jgi:bifunctional non-homologous end joining protein LigD
VAALHGPGKSATEVTGIAVALSVGASADTSPLPKPFDDPDWLFELKYDGFRALAYVRRGAVELRSRTEHVYRQFAPLSATIADELADLELVLDGEIACLDEQGRTQFDALMYRRGAPCRAGR